MNKLVAGRWLSTRHPWKCKGQMHKKRSLEAGPHEVEQLARWKISCPVIGEVLKPMVGPSRLADDTASCYEGGGVWEGEKVHALGGRDLLSTVECQMSRYLAGSYRRLFKGLFSTRKYLDL